jgi:hypothetical protein
MRDISILANVTLGQLDPSGAVKMPDWMAPTSVIIICVILLTFLPVEIYVLAKVGRGIDCSSKLILIAFTLSFILRGSIDVGNWIGFDPSNIIDNKVFGSKLTIVIQMIVSLIERMKWIILYFFILEMKNV